MSMYNDINLKETHKQKEAITFGIKPRRIKLARKEQFYCEDFLTVFFFRTNQEISQMRHLHGRKPSIVKYNLL